jgi:hypothetical protein
MPLLHSSISVHNEINERAIMLYYTIDHTPTKTGNISQQLILPKLKCSQCITGEEGVGICVKQTEVPNFVSGTVREFTGLSQ